MVFDLEAFSDRATGAAMAPSRVRISPAAVVGLDIAPSKAPPGASEQG
jgi:hypothetical protein